MTVTELNSVRDLRQRIREQERRLNALRLSVQNLTPLLDGMPHSRSQTSRVEKIVVKAADLEREIESLRDECAAAAVTLTDKISAANLESHEETILILRYVACMNFRDIEFELGMSDARIFYLHRNSLRKVKADLNAVIGEKSFATEIEPPTNSFRD